MPRHSTLLETSKVGHHDVGGRDKHWRGSLDSSKLEGNGSTCRDRGMCGIHLVHDVMYIHIVVCS